MSTQNLATLLWRLLPTLYIKTHITATSYSKVLRGLRFPLENSGLYTRKMCSGDTNSGQRRSRYALHARRQLNDKVFRYLKRIIVIPAVYLFLAPLERSLKCRHWADVTIRTHHFWLANRCVFIKQSELPSHCTL